MTGASMTGAPMNGRVRKNRIRRSPAARREGAAMLIVLMVLLMTSATASFAIHSTTMEMRSAGYSRQAMQAGYVAEGGAYASLAYVDAMGAQAAFVQYSRTRVPANTPYAPGAPTFDRETNLLRVTMDDFAIAPGVEEPPLETEVAASPSLGARSVYQPSFMVAGTDLYQTFRQVAGRDQSGRDPMSYVRLNMTARGTMAPPGDYRSPSDPDRDFHETAMNARAMAEMGPFAGGF